LAEPLEPDLCVIGAGSGGLSVAAAAAAFGVSVVLIEKGKTGGDCLNYGCVPSKALLAAAKRAHECRNAGGFGILTSVPNVDFRQIQAHVHGVIAAIAPNDSAERFTALGVRVIFGEAKFRDRRTVVAGEHEIRARRFIIASGSSPAVPPIPGLDQVPFFTNETIFDLSECPRRLLVIGAGPIGLELAQAFRRLGADVTVIEAETSLSKDDSECAAILLDQLAKEGITIRERTNVIRVEHGSSLRLTLDGPNGAETLEGTHLLVAAGRKPNVEALGLEAAGIRRGHNGIRLRRGLKTTNRRVYAIGDAAGGPDFTHVAGYHAGLVIRNALFRVPISLKRRTPPWVTFTDPELAQAGHTEAEARKLGKIRVLRWPYHENDRARTERATRGHIKIITTPRGRILGATIVGAHAGELIAAWALAVEQRLNIRAFADAIVPYPTLAEIGKRAAITFFTPRLTSPSVRRLIAFLRRFG
jgi:pyruvate/2-oxoglutarate dehydrogenase complex dihydrolipoamide dehydrogenase (E3) component